MMKKLASALLLVIAVIGSATAQHREKRKFNEEWTPEQSATLAVKKMALHLELSEEQQKKIKPLLLAQMKESKTMYKLRKEAIDKNKKISADNKFKRANEHLDRQLAFQKNLKAILTPEQYAKFKKGHAARKKARVHKKMAMKKRMKMKKLKELNEDDKD